MNKQRVYHHYLNSAINLNKEYLEWIFNSSKIGVDSELLFAIVVIEKMNRGTFLNRCIERIISTLAPSIIIKLNASIGLCQIRVETAKKVVTMSDKDVVKSLMSAEDSINILSKLLKFYIDKIAGDKIDFDKTVLNLYTTGKKSVPPNIYLDTYYELVEYSMKNKYFFKIYTNYCKK